MDAPCEPPAPWNDTTQVPKLRNNALDSPHVFVAQEAIFDFNGKHRRPRQASDQPAPSAMHGMPYLGEAKPLGCHSCATRCIQRATETAQGCRSSVTQLLGAVTLPSCSHAGVWLPRIGDSAPRSIRLLA
ncbi:Hypothetical protein GSB_152210 [Giardia duodenalis]|uniref:Uncharacterized protein n=1 Tax=Giardia intestinalis TaxID=5741 RepID=V6TNB2_GIAIN|nr:Hypothetical protein GSB_152210 [Giardia intestinalis]